jgi:hypothetical protein
MVIEENDSEINVFRPCPFIAATDDLAGEYSCDFIRPKILSSS